MPIDEVGYLETFKDFHLLSFHLISPDLKIKNFVTKLKIPNNERLAEPSELSESVSLVEREFQLPTILMSLVIGPFLYAG